MDKIIISIIIPTYKRNDNLKRAIESVLIENAQYELIVVDDNDENTEYRMKNEELMKKYKNDSRVKFVKHPYNKNGAAARNTGIKLSKGKYITFLDDDDEFCNRRIEKVIEAIKEYNEPDFLYTDVLYKANGILVNKGKHTNIESFKNTELIYILLNQKSFFGTGSNMICKKSIIEEINGFDESFIRHQDLEFMIRYLEKVKKIKYINEYLVIKNSNDKINIPSFEKMYDVKIKFIKKFEYILSNYSKKQKNEILKNNYYQLLSIAYLTNEKGAKKKARSLLIEKNIYSCIHEFKIMIRRLVKNILNKLKYYVYSKKN